MAQAAKLLANSSSLFAQMSLGKLLSTFQPDALLVQASLDIAVKRILEFALQGVNPSIVACIPHILQKRANIEDNSLLKALITEIGEYYNNKIDAHVFKETVHDLAELEKFVTFVASLYNLKAISSAVLIDILEKLLLPIPSSDLKVYLGCRIVEIASDVLILDSTNIYYKIMARIDNLRKSQSLAFTPGTKKILSDVIDMYASVSKNGNAEYRDLLIAYKAAKSDLDKKNELERQIEEQIIKKNELLGNLNR